MEVASGLAPSGQKRDSARLAWDTKPRRAPNPKDIDFQTAELVIPNPTRQQSALTAFAPLAEKGGIDKTQMNRLIWGDNLLAMQVLLASGYEGKFSAIYIDPPFSSGEDYYTTVTVSGHDIEKAPSVIERLAYTDVWKAGLDSYLDMMFPRLQLMKRLLSDDGNIFVHMDSHMVHYVKTLLDEVFGKENFVNDIIWRRVTAHGARKGAGNIHDTILWFSKSDDFFFAQPEIPLRKEYIEDFYRYTEKDGRKYTTVTLSAKGPGPPRRFGNRTIAPPPGTHLLPRAPRPVRV